MGLPLAALAQTAENAPPALSPDAAQCLALAGPADAGVPANAAEGAARQAALAASAGACGAAAAADGAPAEVLYHAAKLAEVRRDAQAARALLERAAALGLGAAETRLGDYALAGILPGGPNPVAAAARYERAAELDDAAGMTSLALLNRPGTGLAADPARMVALLERAAGLGYHFAQHSLARTYLTGEGIPGGADAGLGIPDSARAVALYVAAAEAGNATAALELARAYGDPATGLEDDPPARARLTSLASRTGLPEAIAALGVLHETGDGVAYGPEIAAGLYVRALETGGIGFETLRRGAPRQWDRDTARAFQTILRERGLYRGAIDGIVGTGTASAARGLAPD